MLNHKEFGMKLIKNLILVVLLATSSNVFAENPIKKANAIMTEMILPVVNTALIIGVCNFIGHCIADSFEATRNVDQKNEKILTICIGLYANCLMTVMVDKIMDYFEDEQESQIA